MKIYNSDSEVILEVEVDDDSYRYRAIKGENEVTLKYSLAEHFDLPVGSYIVFENETYTLMRDEDLKMQHRRQFDYTVTLESAQAKAKIWKMRNTVDRRLKFSYTAKPIEHLQLFVDNMNMRDSGWEAGECVDGVETCISYDHVYLYDALGQMADTFNTEFEISGKTVSLKTVEYNKSNPLPLSYGKGNGFKSGVGRSNYGDTPPIEILYIQGGSDNIDASKYGSSTLLLPKGQAIGYDGEHFSDEDGFNSESARWYVVDEDGFGIRRSDKELSSMAEDSLDCSGIYPKRVGTVTAVECVDEGNNFYDIVDDTIPDDLNYEDYLIEGETMTVIFQSGMLAGKEFDVAYYHEEKSGKAARRFELVPTEIDGITMPGDVYVPQVGDTYAVFNCYLPDAYISDNATKSGAEWDMFREAVRTLFDEEETKYTFTGELDGIWSKKDWINIGGRIVLGGYVEFTDESFQPDPILIRITGIKDYINNPYSPTLELSNTSVSTSFTTSLIQMKSQEVLMEDNKRDVIQYTKRRFRDAQETMDMLESALLENFTESITPITVQTMSLLVGDESLQFRFVNSKTNPVQVTHEFLYDQDAKQLSTDSGIIQHMTLGISSISNEHAASEYLFWDVSAYISAVLDDADQSYYFYAKVSRTGTTGTFLLSEEAIAMDADSDYYHLLVGILNSEYDGERSFVTLFGYTEVLPGRITTDLIISSDGKTYFDLVNSVISGRITFVNSTTGETTTLQDFGDTYYTFVNSDLEERLQGIIDSIEDLGDSLSISYENMVDLLDAFKIEVSGDFDSQEENFLALLEQLSNDLGIDISEFYDELSGTIVMTYDELMALINELESKYESYQSEVRDKMAEFTESLEDLEATFSTSLENYEKILNAYNVDISDKLEALSGDLDGQVAYLQGLFEDFGIEVNIQINEVTGQIEAIEISNEDLKKLVEELQDYYDSLKQSVTYMQGDVEEALERVGVSEEEIDALKDANGDLLVTIDELVEVVGGKAQVFSDIPVPPYNVDDLWADGTKLMRCIQARTAKEDFSSLDWVEAVYYDCTQTVIDGGIVTSGTIQVAGSQQYILAGITGQGTEGTSVRFWAGTTFDNRAIAPFQVLQNGTLIATDATITGTINATSGEIGGYEISSDSQGSYLIGSDTSGNNITLRPNYIKFYNESVSSSVYIGADAYAYTFGSSQINPVQIIVNHATTSNTESLIGLTLNVQGCSEYNDSNNFPYAGNTALLIPNGRICGIRPRARRVTVSQALTIYDTIIFCTASSNITLTLPSGCEDGQVYLVRKMGSGNITYVCASSSDLLMDKYGSTSTSIKQEGSVMALLTYDAVDKRWCYNVMPYSD